MFKTSFSGVASTPYWALEVSPGQEVEIRTPSSKKQGLYSDFVHVATNLPEIFGELSSINSPLYQELAPRMVDMMGAKEFVCQVLTARGWDVQRHTENFMTFRHPEIKKFSGGFVDKQFFWKFQSEVRMNDDNMRSMGAEVFFKTEEDDFDVKFLTVINSDANSRTHGTDGGLK